MTGERGLEASTRDNIAKQHRRGGQAGARRDQQLHCYHQEVRALVLRSIVRQGSYFFSFRVFSRRLNPPSIKSTLAVLLAVLVVGAGIRSRRWLCWCCHPLLLFFVFGIMVVYFLFLYYNVVTFLLAFFSGAGCRVTWLQMSTSRIFCRGPALLDFVLCLPRCHRFFIRGCIELFLRTIGARYGDRRC